MFPIILIACAPEPDVQNLTPIPPAPEVLEIAELQDSGVLVAEPVVAGEYEVVRAISGDTLLGIAGLAGVSVEEIASLNGIPVTHPLLANEELRIPAGTGFVAAREATLDAKLDAWFEAHGGLVGVQGRTVATGDTAWGVAMEEGVPLWVLTAFNRSTDLDRIRIGDTLYLPVVGDSVQAPTEEGAVE